VIVLGFILAVLFWVIESTVHVIMLPDRDLIDELFAAERHEIWMRCIYSVTIVLFACLSQYFISRQKRIEAELKESEGKYRTFLETLTDIVFTLDMNGRFTYLNPLAQSISGYRPEDLIGRPFRGILSPEAKQISLERFKKGMEEEGVPLYEVEIVRADGRIIPMEISVKALRDFSGKIASWIGVARDISLRKSVEAALREEKEKFRVLAESTPTAIMLFKDDTWIYANPAAEMISGYSTEELQHMLFWEIIHPDFRSLVQDRVERRLQGLEPVRRYELKIISKERKEIWVDLSGATIILDGMPTGIISAFDITERKNSEQALKESESKYRTILESIEEGYFELDLNGCFTFFNNSLCKILEYPKERLLGMDYRVLVPAATRRMISRTAKAIYDTGRQQEIINFDAVRGDKNIGTLEMSLTLIHDSHETAIGFRGIVRDITDRKRLEAQLLQAQKMEAIGTLAGGIAHDFNNLLMAIQGNTSLMSIGMETDHPYHKRIKHIEQCVQSGSDLTRQLLGFARGGKYEIKPTDINYIIQKTSELFGQTKKEIRLQRKYQEDLWCVEVDKGQIEQVLLNLYVNAWQAMPEGGDLYIESSNVALEENDVRTHDTKPGPYVRISVSDTGVGMDEKTMRRIFEPFFSTKDMSRGSGLGLASAYGIVKNHGGIITVSSKKGKGSTFHVYLPASDKIASGDAVEGSQKMLSGTETILLVDDETMIVEIGSELLKQLGYTVLTASGGHEAVETFADHKDTIDLVILDMIMPGLGGSETFDRIRQMRGDVKVILSSGYSINGHAAKILNKGCNGFIQKPFDITAFSRKIREVLDSHAAGKDPF